MSLTDRAGCAVCLLAAEPAAIGCDLELVEPRSDAFVGDYLTGPERRWVARQPGQHVVGVSDLAV